MKQLAHECGFELAGVASAVPIDDFSRFETWRHQDFAGDMGYLTDRRGDMRADPRNLLPEARTMLCVGKLYNSGASESEATAEAGIVARYARGADYHESMRNGLQQLAGRLESEINDPFQWRICIDTAPLLERSYARLAGLGWIGRNTCLINQQSGSWFLLGELLLSLDLTPDVPPPDRCGTCRRCIDACPTSALLPQSDGSSLLDSRRCISYLTIEKRGVFDGDQVSRSGSHVFGCDICQEVCPWNRRAPVTTDPDYGWHWDLTLSSLAGLSPEQFRSQFGKTPISRAKYSGFLRNVAVALGNSGDAKHAGVLQELVKHSDPVVAQTATSALETLKRSDV